MTTTHKLLPIVETLGYQRNTLPSTVSTRNLRTTDETAERLGYQRNTLERWRGMGKGPRFIKMGPRKQDAVRYRDEDIDAWLAERTCSNTSQYMSLPQQAQHP